MNTVEYLLELDIRERLMPVRLDYARVEALVKVLAARLIDTVGLPELRAARYVAIPRGGNIVLGMLSYVLDLDRQALQPASSGSVLVIVDDCSNSGHRFADFLQTCPQERVVFAHLCSAPGLREAVLERETRVIACVAAMDLTDLTRELYPAPEEYQSWLAECRQRPPLERYLHAVLQGVTFPWNEPDFHLLHPVTGKPLDYWRLQPPDACLKNWARLGLLPANDLHPVVRCHPDVAHALIDDQVLLSHRHTRRVHLLTGLDADRWRALAASGDYAIAVNWLATRHGGDRVALRHELERFAREWIERGVFVLAE